MPLIIQPQNFNVYYHIILQIFGFLFFIFVYWFKTRSMASDYYRLDKAFAVFFISLFIGRLIGIFMNIESYKILEWHISPVLVIENQITLFSTFPWVFFKLFDGAFAYSGAVLGVFFASLTFSKSKTFSRNFQIFIEAGISAIFIYLLFLIAGEFLSGTLLGTIIKDAGILGLKYSNGLTRFPLALLIIAVIVLLMVFRFILRKSFNFKHIYAGLALIIFGITDFFLHFFEAEYSASIMNVIDFYQVLNLIVVALGVILLYNTNKKTNQGLITSGGNINTSARVERVPVFENFPDSKKSFSLSYANIDSRKYERFTLKEYLQKFLNLFKSKRK